MPVSNVENCYDLGDLKSEVKVKCMNEIKDLVTMHPEYIYVVCTFNDNKLIDIEMFTEPI